MARKERRDNSKLRELMEEYGVKTMEDVQNFIKMPTAETIQTTLDAELENELGYSKYDSGTSKRTTAAMAIPQRPYRAALERWKSACHGIAMANMSHSSKGKCNGLPFLFHWFIDTIPNFV